MEIEEAARAFRASLADSLKTTHEKAMADLKDTHDKAMADLKAEYNDRATKLQQKHQETLSEFETGFDQDCLAFVAKYFPAAAGATTTVNANATAGATASAPSASNKRTRSPAPAEIPSMDGTNEHQDKRTCHEPEQTAETRPKRTPKPAASKDYGEIVVSHPNKKTPTDQRPLDLQFCANLLEVLRDPSLYSSNLPFLAPVRMMDYPDYYIKITRPMDLQTMGYRLNNGTYRNAEEFKKDFELMIQNCNDYNPPGQPVRDCGIKLRRLFEEQWNGKDRWVRTMQRKAAQDGGEDEEEDDDGETSFDVDRKQAMYREAAKREEERELARVQAKHPRRQIRESNRL